MKTHMIFALLIIVMGCKKKEVKPQTTEDVQPICETKTKVFEGKYEAQSDSKDTITIVFIHNNCPTEGVNTYSVYGLGKAYNKALGSSLDENKVSEINSNENEKSVTSSQFKLWITGTGNLGSTYNNIGSLYFKKL